MKQHDRLAYRRLL